MTTPISTSDPLFAALTSLPAAFLSDVVDLINGSQNLLGEINRLDATTLAGGGTAEIRSQTGQDNGGNTSYHDAVINIAALSSYDDTTLIAGGGSLAAGRTQNITPAGTFVGVLAHEIAHWGDAQLGPLYMAGGMRAYTIEQAVATEFASEGKAATSQYTAMTQIQASEAAQPIPADMANGNILFDVDGIPLLDTAMLQHVQSIAPGATSHAADVSYLGSQFWNVAVDGGTYLSTMWGSYGAAGANDDLGIRDDQIVEYKVSETAAGTLAACTIETSTASGTAWTYQIACAVPGSQQAQITDTATGAAVASVDTVVTPAGGGVQLSIVADAFSFTVIDDAVATVRGNDDTLTLGRGDSLLLTGSGITVTGAAGNMISLSASSSAVIAAAVGGTIALDGDAAAVNVLGTGARVGLSGNDDAASASGSTVSLAAAIAGSVTGNGDVVILGARDALTSTGDRDTIILAGDGGSSEGVCLSGSQDRLFGGSGDLRLTLSGASSTVVLTGGHATISGASAGTTVFGGASDVDYGGGGGILVMGAGASTVAGATAGAHETIFGGASGLLYQGAQEYADVVGGAGSCTIHAGLGGGWYGGSAAGDNFLAATGAGTVLEAGGNGDTLVGAAGGGAYLIAAAGNETLYGGNQAGESTLFLGSGSDLLMAGQGGSIVATGTGTATIHGGGGHDQIWAGSGGADQFVAGTGGQLEVHGFRTGTDHLLSGGQAVSAAVQTGGGTLFSLSSGATIMLAGVDAQPGTVFA